MSKSSGWRTVFCLFVFCGLAVIGASAQGFKSLVSFNVTNGEQPYYGSLVQGIDGNLYGTTYGGGANGVGSIFKMTPGGALTTFYSFCSLANCADGSGSVSGLAVAANGTLFGTTFAGGDLNCDPPSGCGTVFKITPAGKLTTLHTFEANGDGAGPDGGLALGANGNFYGTTGWLGGDGTIFEITPAGTLTTLHFFAGTDGSGPYATLALGANGNFYGTTYLGGTSLSCNDGCGTIFEITPGGMFTSLLSFEYTDGAYPVGGLVQAANGNLYGTTAGGGGNELCFAGISGCGTIFELTAAGKLTTLYDFCSETGCTDGGNPYSTLLRGTDGNFYGTTYIGGANTGCEDNCGTVFQLTAGGKLITLHSFDGTDGAYPYDGLIQGTNGSFYGTTDLGGTGGCLIGCGTVFSESVGLRPFVQTVPAFGKTGALVTILGSNLKGATSVTFNGVAATFTASNSNISTTVPSGATTGFVQVITPNGTLTSNVEFRVL